MLMRLRARIGRTLYRRRGGGERRVAVQIDHASGTRHSIVTSASIAAKQRREG